MAGVHTSRTVEGARYKPGDIVNAPFGVGGDEQVYLKAVVVDAESASTVTVACVDKRKDNTGWWGKMKKGLECDFLMEYEDPINNSMDDGLDGMNDIDMDFDELGGPGTNVRQHTRMGTHEQAWAHTHGALRAVCLHARYGHTCTRVLTHSLIHSPTHSPTHSLSLSLVFVSGLWSSPFLSRLSPSPHYSEPSSSRGSSGS